MRSLRKNNTAFLSVHDIATIISFFVCLPISALIFYLVFQGILNANVLPSGTNTSFISEGFNTVFYLLPILPLIYAVSLIVGSIVGRKQREEGELIE